MSLMIVSFASSTSPFIFFAASLTIFDIASEAVDEKVSFICCCIVVAPESVIFGAIAFFFSFR